MLTKSCYTYQHIQHRIYVNVIKSSSVGKLRDVASDEPTYTKPFETCLIKHSESDRRGVANPVVIALTTSIRSPQYSYTKGIFPIKRAQSTLWLAIIACGISFDVLVISYYILLSVSDSN